MKLPYKRQVQIVADLLRGDPDTGVELELLKEPWREYLRWIRWWLGELDASETPDPEALREDFLDYKLVDYKEENRATWATIEEAMRDPVEYVSMDRMIETLPDYDWLWEGWIARGLWTLLAAEPGTGKSYVSLDLARRICMGEAFPDGSPGVDGKVVWVEAENRPSVIKERMKVWRLEELQRFWMMQADPDRWVIDFDEFDDRDRFLDMMWNIRPELVVVDSYGSVTSKGENTKEDVQQLLAFLNMVAVEFDCGMIVVHHLRKPPGGQKGFMPMSLNSVRGSGHIGAMASTVLGMQWVPTSAEANPNGPRKLWCLKNNLSLFPDPLGVMLGPHPDNERVATVRYGDAPEPYRSPSNVELCADWIVDVIRECGEPMSPAEVIELGQREGYGERMVYRARKKLGDEIVDTEGYRHPQNRWATAEMAEDRSEGEA